MPRKYAMLVASAVLAFVAAIYIIVRITLVRHDFDRMVKRALKTSAGYDKEFISMVNRLEHELATRASFGYQGGKDPMTGRVRQVVQQRLPVQTRQISQVKTQSASAEDKKDPVRLTAIIFDEINRRFTAIVMDGERSLSLEVGDVVHGRRVQKVTDKVIVMEDDNTVFWYDVFGNSDAKRK